jgi:hypothetical protein
LTGPVATFPAPETDHVQVYKRILQEVLDRRPSGTRQRLADVLQRNRSFITQIANPAYAVPVPSRHVATILEVCHFSPTERAAFLEAYHLAHPRSLVAVSNRARGRQVHMMLPDFGTDEKNAAFDELLGNFLGGIARLASGKAELRNEAKADAKSITKVARED